MNADITPAPPTKPPAPAAMPTPPAPPAPAGRPLPAPGQKTSNGWRNVVSTIAVLLLAPSIALLLTAFVFQSYQVDGPSMESTLQSNDRLIVWKMQKTWSRITHHAYIPHRGDVVVFTDPKIAEFGQDAHKQLIKRVIALPGERVVVKDNVVTVYNQQRPQGFRPDVTLPYGKVIGITPGDAGLVVAPNQIFVCGDNRTNSLDSRAFGPVAAKDIVGKLVARVLPLGQAKRF